MRHVEVYKDDILFKTFPSITEAAKQMDRNVSMCRKFLNDNKKDNRGFEWKFLELK